MATENANEINQLLTYIDARREQMHRDRARLRRAEMEVNITARIIEECKRELYRLGWKG